MFNRTTSGMINKYLFYPEPILWVEGDDDFPFYEPLRNKFNCQIFGAGGKPVCRKLAEAVIDHDYPYVVIMDGDLEILENDSNPHTRVLQLKKYAIENYLFEQRIIQNVSSKYIGNEEKLDEIRGFFESVEADIQACLYDLVVLDVANYKENTGIDFFPDSADGFINMKSVRCLPERINPICDSTRAKIRMDAIEQAKQLVDKYVLGRRLSDLVRGHFLFGILRHSLISCIRTLAKKKIYIDNDSLLILLSLEMWNLRPTEYHESLENDIKLALTDVIQMKSA